MHQRAQRNQIRIIGGDWRGRKLDFPSIDGLRPTGDRIRETLFNWIASDISGANVLDLFAGSGALGLEALSRGASSARFVEPDPGACSCIRDSLALLEVKNAKVAQNRAEEYIDQLEKGTIDILFFDPPFGKNLHENISTQVDIAGILASDALIYVESPIDETIKLPSNWRELKNKKTGSVRYQLLQSE